MTVNNIKELKKLIQLCQETGVDSIKIDNLEIKLGNDPKSAKKLIRSITPENTPANDPFSFENVSIQYQVAAEQAKADNEEPVELTEEQLLFYSVSEEPQP